MSTNDELKNESPNDAKPVLAAVPLDCEIRTPIEDCLYATGIFTTTECTYLAEGILKYLADAKMKVVWQ